MQIHVYVLILEFIGCKFTGNRVEESTVNCLIIVYKNDK